MEKYLLENSNLMITHSDCNSGMDAGYLPTKRPLEEYLKYGVIVLDKPANPSSHEEIGRA